MQDFRKLQVWKRAHQATLDVYQATAAFPRDELYGLTSQLRRSASSICANIAEGCGRSGDAEFGRFINIALGSASELDYHLQLALDLGLMPKDAYDALASEVFQVRRMLGSLLLRVKGNTSPPVDH